jgi:hypothetical protein
MFLAAFTSRSWTVPHAAHVHSRTCSGFGPSLTPQAEQTWLVGSNRPAYQNWRPYSLALYSSMDTDADQPCPAETGLAEFTGKASHVHPDAGSTPPRTGTSRRLRHKFPGLRHHHSRANWLQSGSYFAGPASAPILGLRQRIEQQNRPA